MKASIGKVVIIASLGFFSASSFAECCGNSNIGGATVGWLGATGGGIINTTASASNEIIQPGAALVGNIWVGLGQLGNTCCR